MIGRRQSWEESFSQLATGKLSKYSSFKASRNVVCLRANTSSGNKVFVKYFTGATGAGEATKVFHAASRYYNAMPRDLGYSCPRPLDCWTDESLGGAYISEWIDDRRGDSYFKTYMPIELARRHGIRRSAEWLGIFHTIGGFKPAPIGKVVNTQAVCSALEQMIVGERNTLRANSSLENQLFDLKQKILRLDKVNATMTRIHGDFTPANLFINKARIVGFDFTAESVSPAATDIAAFLSPLLWYGSIKFLFNKGAQFSSDLDLFLKHYTRYNSADNFDAIVLFSLAELIRRLDVLEKQYIRANTRKRWSKSLHSRIVSKALRHVASRLI